MFPYSDFPRPVGSFLERVPIPAHEPGEGSQVCVMFNVDWLPYVLGSLQQLLLQSTWDTNDKTALFGVQGSAFDLIALIGNGINGDTCVAFRVSGCLLQISYDGGVTWSTLVDLSSCTIPGPPGPTGAPGTPGAPGAPTPVDGPTAPPSPMECFEQDVDLGGGSSFILPFQIKGGDEIDFTALTGGWTDGSLSDFPGNFGLNVWYCWCGELYGLGACTTTGGYPLAAYSTDPFTGGKHAELIGSHLNSDGTGIVFFSVAENESYTVPPGTPPGFLTLQMNNSPLSAGSGSISFHIKVCTGVVEGCPEDSAWSHEFDFTVSEGGWADAGNGTTWSTAGWLGGTVVATPCDVYISRAFTSANVNRVTVYMTQSAVGDPNADNQIYWKNGATVEFHGVQSPVNGTGVSYVFDSDQTVDSLLVDFNGGNAATSVCTKIVVCGKGPEPDWSA